MPTSYGDKFASSGLWSPQHRLVLRLLVLTGLGLGTGTVISSYLRLKKKVGDDDGYTEEDLISAMPSDILCSILSRLDTKDVVRTSILSSRWSNLYLFLPYYSFSCRCSFEIPFRGQCSCTAEYRKEFMTVLDRFFRMPRGAGCEKIKSFCLSLCVNRDFTCHIERWVRQIAGLGVEELTLRLCCQQHTKHITFPLQKLLCEAAAPMLKSLHLAACILEPFNPQHPFKSLTSLRLGYIESVDVQGVLSSCPELESLTLEYCCLPSKLFIGGGKQLKLKSLIIYRCHGGVNEISLCAENLVILEVQLWIDSTMKFPHPTNAPKLQHVNITVMRSDDMCDIIRWVGKDCPQVESLYLDLPFGNHACAYSLPREVPTFGHMRQLYILMEFNELFDVTQVAALITGCPLLQRLHLVGRGRKPCYLRIGERASLGNHHLHLHLKEVEFGGFLGLENEVALVLYILKNALALERMVLCRDYRWYTGASKGGRWEERKDYKGPTWLKNPPYTVTFDESKLQTIHQQLRGQAASPTAQVIVI